MQPLRQPQRVLLADPVAGVIEDGVVVRRWPERLPGERSLTRVLNVSRQTWRVALVRLAVRGRVAVEPRRGYRVVSGPGPNRRLRPDAARELGLICSEPVCHRANRDVIARHLFGLVRRSRHGGGGAIERIQLGPELVSGESVAPCKA